MDISWHPGPSTELLLALKILETSVLIPYGMTWKPKETVQM